MDKQAMSRASDVFGASCAADHSSGVCIQGVPCNLNCSPNGVIFIIASFFVRTVAESTRSFILPECSSKWVPC